MGVRRQRLQRRPPRSIDRLRPTTLGSQQKNALWETLRQIEQRSQGKAQSGAVGEGGNGETAVLRMPDRLRAHAGCSVSIIGVSWRASSARRSIGAAAKSKAAPVAGMAALKRKNAAGVSAS